MLQPGQSAPIVRQLGLPGDSSTYYVQAVVKNSATGATITTINLTDQGSQRFTGSFDVPQDPLGFGYYIDITTSVYTDSGYTTLSNIYTIDMQSLLVFDRLTWGRNVGGGGDMTDYDKIAKMIREEIKGIDFPEIPKPEKVNLEPVLATIWETGRRVEDKLDAIDTKTRDASIVKAVDKLGKSILSKMDEATIMAKLQKMIKGLEIAITNETKEASVHRKTTTTSVEDIVSAGNSMLEKLTTALGKIEALHKAVKEESDTERTAKIENAIKEMGEELANLFMDNFGNSDNAAQNLITALSKMAEKSLKGEDAEEKDEKKEIESPYVETAKKLLED